MTGQELAEKPLFSLSELKDAVIYKAIAGGSLDPLATFLNEMELRWGNAPTAYATRIEGVPVIELGTEFFKNNVRDLNEAADVVLHEIMHHVFLHLFMMEELSAKGYSHAHQNIAMDAIINAFLHSIKCSGFMERFYKDENEFAFLRPNSTEFRLKKSFLGVVESVKETKTDNPRLHAEFVAFHKRLYALSVDLQASLDFFAKHFPKPSNDQPLIGDHKADSGASKSSKNKKEGSSSSGNKDTKEEKLGDIGSLPKPESKPDSEEDKPKDKKADSSSSKAENKQEGESVNSGSDIPADKVAGQKKAQSDKSNKGKEPLIDKQEALNALRNLKVKAVSKKAENNFATIIAKIVRTHEALGDKRADTYLARRPRVKLGRRDLINMETGRNLFVRQDYLSQDVWLLIDVSGSMSAYVPFIVGLLRSLERRNVRVHAAAWASRLKEVPYKDLIKGELPRGLGGDTVGENVARFIKDKKIKECVIITDNEAGTISTYINALVHLCLVEGSRKSGSFLAKDKVAKIRIHQLLLDAAK